MDLGGHYTQNCAFRRGLTSELRWLPSNIDKSHIYKQHALVRATHLSESELFARLAEVDPL